MQGFFFWKIFQTVECLRKLTKRLIFLCVATLPLLAKKCLNTLTCLMLDKGRSTKLVEAAAGTDTAALGAPAAIAAPGEAVSTSLARICPSGPLPPNICKGEDKESSHI